MLTAEETRELLDMIDTDTLVGLRDRAVIWAHGLQLRTRECCNVSMKVADYYTQSKHSYFRLHEKGGKYHVVPAHHVRSRPRGQGPSTRKGRCFDRPEGRRRNVLLRSSMTSPYGNQDDQAAPCVRPAYP